MRQLFLLLILVFFFPVAVEASSTEAILALAQELELSDHPTWLKLLHYEPKQKQSVVLTDAFFLSKEGRYDPEAELIATIKAYFSEQGKQGDKAARCLFPARYFWLSKQLPLPNYDLREPGCESLERWALFDRVKSISLLLVSGYFGNPASTFGHALLKLNTDSEDDQQGLFDLTLNYGALVPENENVFRYIAKGLFGGYEAGFSDRYYFSEDMVYSRTEFRDIWEYKLDLTDDQRMLLIFHIWEIVGKKFDYYFLEKNCAYRLAELLDLVVEEEIITNIHPWYVPVELFHRLNTIDQHRDTPLIQSVRYIPSGRRQLYHQLEWLSPQELKRFNKIVLEGTETISEHLADLNEDQQIVVLDGLLAYQQYRLIAEGPEAEGREETKNQILRSRLALPPKALPPLNIQELRSPAEGSRPMSWGGGVVLDSDDNLYTRLQYSPFKKELVGRNSLEGNELVLFDISLGIADRDNKVFLDEVDIMRILKLNPLPIEVVDETQWSWNLRIGVDRSRENNKNYYDGVFSFGAGRSWKWHPMLTAYGMVDFAGHTRGPHVRLRPHMGFRVDWGSVRSWFYMGGESVDYHLKFTDVWGGKMQYELNEQYALKVEFSNEDAATVFVGFDRYF